MISQNDRHTTHKHSSNDAKDRPAHTRRSHKRSRLHIHADARTRRRCRRSTTHRTGTCRLRSSCRHRRYGWERRDGRVRWHGRPACERPCEPGGSAGCDWWGGFGVEATGWGGGGPGATLGPVAAPAGDWGDGGRGGGEGHDGDGFGVGGGYGRFPGDAGGCGVPGWPFGVRGGWDRGGGGRWVPGCPACGWGWDWGGGSGRIPDSPVYTWGWGWYWRCSGWWIPDGPVHTWGGGWDWGGGSRWVPGGPALDCRAGGNWASSCRVPLWPGAADRARGTRSSWLNVCRCVCIGVPTAVCCRHDSVWGAGRRAPGRCIGVGIAVRISGSHRPHGRRGACWSAGVGNSRVGRRPCGCAPRRTCCCDWGHCWAAKWEARSSGVPSAGNRIRWCRSWRTRGCGRCPRAANQEGFDVRRVTLSIDLVVLWECGFPQHGTTELSRILALEVRKNLFSLGGVQVHFSVCSARSCWEAKVHKSVGILRVGLHPRDPCIVWDVGSRSAICTIGIIKEGASWTLGSIVKLDEDRIKEGVGESVADIRVGDNALWWSSDHHFPESAKVVHHRSIMSTLWYWNSAGRGLNIEIKPVHTSIAEWTWSSPGLRWWAESSVQKVSKCNSWVVAG